MNPIYRALRWLQHTHTRECIWRFQASETVNGRTYGPWLYCVVCDSTVLLICEPPADHPESMTALPAEQEEWLAAVDRELWSKEAA